MPAPLELRLKEETERMTKEDVIEEASGASWVSAIHVVYKGNGELRISVDLREVKKAVIRERFPKSETLVPDFSDLYREI